MSDVGASVCRCASFGSGTCGASMGAVKTNGVPHSHEQLQQLRGV